MTGVLWAIVAGVGFGLFQSCNRRAGRSIDPYVSTFSLLLISAIILVLASAFTEDLSLLWTIPLRAFAYFGLAGIVHFLLGWTLLSLSQARIGAARTGALIGTTPLFAFIVGLAVFGEFLNLPIVVGMILVLAGAYVVSSSGRRKGSQPSAQTTRGPAVTWRNSLFGLGTAVCFSLSAVFIRAGLVDLPSPLLGVTIGMVITATVYGIILLQRRGQARQGSVPMDAALFQLAAGVFVALSTWARWIALDKAPVAVVMSVGRVNVPVVMLVAPLLVGRKLERVTGRVWLGAALIVAGSVMLNAYS